MRESQAIDSATPKIRFAVVPSCTLAVDPRAQAERAEVAGLVKRHERRPAGRESVDRLATGPECVLQLQVARADVIEGHRAGEVGERIGGVYGVPRRPITTASSAS